jgi:predicted GIY-YIG superfamily endonuclease
VSVKVSKTDVLVKAKPCTVYLVHAIEHGLVYVGIADDFDRRWAQHRRQSWWLGEVVVEEVRLYHMWTREAARQMEAAIINREKPRYNTALEEGAYRRYRAAAESTDENPWPVAYCEVVDAEGETLWSEI